MRTATYFLGIALFLGAIFVSCEGPEGPAGEDGIAVCGECHNSGTALKAKQLEFGAGAHSLGTYYYRTGSCSGCHSNEGFLARITFTSISEMDALAEENQTPIGCRTCHTIHNEYNANDWGLTLATQVKETVFGYGTTLPDNYQSISFPDLGDANLCVQCHQSRDVTSLPSLTSTDSLTLSSRFGPHHGPQGNVMLAVAGINITGSSSYPSTGSGHATIDNSCIACHMYEGNHDLAVNFDACVSCHSTADNAETLVEDLHAEVSDLLTTLGTALAAQNVMTANADGTFTPKSKKVSAKQARAVFNYMTIYEDRSLGVHNPTYVKALLNNTIASL